MFSSKYVEAFGLIKKKEETKEKKAECKSELSFNKAFQIVKTEFNTSTFRHPPCFASGNYTTVSIWSFSNNLGYGEVNRIFVISVNSRD